MVEKHRVKQEYFDEFTELYRKYKPNVVFIILNHTFDGYIEFKITRKYNSKKRKNKKYAPYGRYEDSIINIICGNCGWIHGRRGNHCPSCNIEIRGYNSRIARMRDEIYHRYNDMHRDEENNGRNY